MPETEYDALTGSPTIRTHSTLTLVRWPYLYGQPCVLPVELLMMCLSSAALRARAFDVPYRLDLIKKSQPEKERGCDYCILQYMEIH